MGVVLFARLPQSFGINFISKGRAEEKTGSPSVGRLTPVATNLQVKGASGFGMTTIKHERGFGK